MPEDSIDDPDRENFTLPARDQTSSIRTRSSLFRRSSKMMMPIGIAVEHLGLDDECEVELGGSRLTLWRTSRRLRRFASSNNMSLELSTRERGKAIFRLFKNPPQ
jgi:hypothetical protein